MRSDDPTGNGDITVVERLGANSRPLQLASLAAIQCDMADQCRGTPYPVMTSG